ncbi:translation initiation factor IF-2-like [Bubalus bubalis]|uniref:translation initiation factor IF-2-like n=1 Tax=Bubalus bubalis TaxID=89462 RepID=UPI001D12B026|nr:translation initiation factor IF-2-like [Bubalus bubalis]
MANTALGATGRGGPAGGTPDFNSSGADSRGAARKSPLLCQIPLGCLRKGIWRQIKRGARSAHPSSAPAGPLPPGWKRAGRGQGARAVPAAHPPANLERCGRSRLRRPAAAWDRSRGPPPWLRASPAPGNNGVPAGAARAGGALGAGAHAKVGRVQDRVRKAVGKSLFGFSSDARCGRGGGVLQPSASPWRDEWGRGGAARPVPDPREMGYPPSLGIWAGSGSCRYQPRGCGRAESGPPRPAPQKGAPRSERPGAESSTPFPRVPPSLPASAPRGADRRDSGAGARGGGQRGPALPRRPGGRGVSAAEKGRRGQGGERTEAGALGAERARRRSRAPLSCKAGFPPCTPGMAPSLLRCGE